MAKQTKKPEQAQPKRPLSPKQQLKKDVRQWVRDNDFSEELNHMRWEASEEGRELKLGEIRAAMEYNGIYEGCPYGVYDILRWG